LATALAPWVTVEMSLTAAKALRDRPNRAAAMMVVKSFMVVSPSVNIE
jgi:hypothetical protein